MLEEREELKIENIIYEIREKQVMLDSDLARLYQCTNGTKDINKAVNRNKEKFPDDFYFQLTNEEYKYLKFQNGTSSATTHGGVRKIPHVFTEQGVAMLATVINTKIAAQISINIMRTFVMMRKYISTSSYENRISNIETKLIDYDNKFDKIFDILDTKVDRHIFFEGQIYDAYSLLIDILKKAKENIILIDGYIDKNILDIISLLDVKVTIVTSNYNKYDIDKYKKQYDNIQIICNKRFHDRFIILDYKVLYHCGASFKDLGKKCFAISKIDDKVWLENIINCITI